MGPALISTAGRPSLQKVGLKWKNLKKSINMLAEVFLGKILWYVRISSAPARPPENCTEPSASSFKTPKNGKFGVENVTFWETLK